MEGRGSLGRALLPGAADLISGALALPLLLTHALFTEDTWWHLALGEQTLRERAIPAVETFSFTAAGTPLASHSWLADALFAALERVGGLGLVEVLGFLVAALVFRTIFAVARALGARPSFAVLPVYLFAMWSAHFLTLRPQLFTYLLLAWLLLACVELHAGRSRMVLAAPLVFVLWSNLHGGFLVGLGFLAGFAAIEVVEGWRLQATEPLRRARTLGGVALLSALAACVHPHGWHEFTDALVNTPVGDSIHELINEWRPPDLGVVPLLPLSIVLAVLAALALGERPPLLEALLVLGSLHLALSAWRHVPIFGIVGAPVLAAWGSRGLRRELPKLEKLLGSGGSLGWWTIVLVALIFGAEEVRARSPVLDAPLVRKKFPVDAVRWVEKNRVGGSRVFATYEWGGYVTHELPSRKIFIDSRMVPFKGVLDDYLVAQRGGPEALAVLGKHQIDWALVARDGALARTLATDPRWRPAYEDELAAVFVWKR